MLCSHNQPSWCAVNSLFYYNYVSPARLLLCLCNLRHTDIYFFIFITATFLYNCYSLLPTL